ncbi:hypothetical protein CEXT_737631 [Caerostris extrusa]|uniref:Transmembrane protein n=1 Tax=Caerostris extrusa TaxID=172846 RepID=A0AAV4PW49_CAEEX|nr:hypothetical protein CEXT_737631 [Caerostris extrusa]
MNPRDNDFDNSVNPHAPNSLARYIEMRRRRLQAFFFFFFISCFISKGSCGVILIFFSLSDSNPEGLAATFSPSPGKSWGEEMKRERVRASCRKWLSGLSSGGTPS